VALNLVLSVKYLPRRLFKKKKTGGNSVLVEHTRELGGETKDQEGKKFVGGKKRNWKKIKKPISD